MCVEINFFCEGQCYSLRLFGFIVSIVTIWTKVNTACAVARNNARGLESRDDKTSNKK
jgi:hypothetical protein